MEIGKENLFKKNQIKCLACSNSPELQMFGTIGQDNKNGENDTPIQIGSLCDSLEALISDMFKIKHRKNIINQLNKKIIY